MKAKGEAKTSREGPTNVACGSYNNHYVMKNTFLTTITNEKNSVYVGVFLCCINPWLLQYQSLSDPVVVAVIFSWCRYVCTGTKAMHNFSRSSQIFTDLQKCLNCYQRRKPRMIVVTNDFSALNQKIKPKLIYYTELRFSSQNEYIWVSNTITRFRIFKIEF